MSFTEIANNVTFSYLLLLIVILLVYIAFYKKPSKRK